MPLSLQNSFCEFCNKNKFEINKKQTEILNSLENFIFPRNKFLNFFSKISLNLFKILTACGLMPPAPQSSGSRFPMFCCLGIHWASWLAPGWSWGSMFCSLGGSWSSWFAPGWSLGSMFSIAYRYCTSSFHMFIAYPDRISLLRIFIAYVYCISLLHISVA